MGFMDGILGRSGAHGHRRAMGPSVMDELAKRADPEAKLASSLAEELVPSDPKRRADPDGLLRLALPALMHQAAPLPVDRDARREFVARTILDSIGRHMRDGPDEGLNPPLGDAARREGVRSVTLRDVRTRGLDASLADRGRDAARVTAAYLADGPEVGKHLDAHLVSIPQRGETLRTLERLRDIREFHTSRQPPSGPDLRAWVRKGLDVERAASRAGLIDPDRIVGIAKRTMRDADVERLSTLPRSRPDFQSARGMDGAARQRTFAESLRTMGSVAASAAIADRPMPTPARQAAIQAHLARSHPNQR